MIGFVFLINMASSMFEPTSLTYITKLIPVEKRKQFNSLRSLIDSGGFLIGPAIAGILFMIGTPEIAIYVNAILLFLSGLITVAMPNLEKHNDIVIRDALSVETLKKDWGIVWKFSFRSLHIMVILLLFSALVGMMTAVDSLEAAFAIEVLGLSDSEYGFLVSIAGGGILVGALSNTIFAKKLSISVLIGLGSIFVSVGYVVYAFSDDFITAAVGFFILSFSLAFANTGFYTFYQNNISAEIMGRVGSVIGLIEAVFIIIVTGIFGITAQIVSIKFVVIIGSLVMLLITTILCINTVQKTKQGMGEI
ncbi:MFS transporter [Virgibacillus ndiopensis]|uniref:MFS transporter n=1 Tax=Virgibacillus ndiopensis TaxID=2004408 RepID=UPI003CCC0FB2